MTSNEIETTSQSPAARQAEFIGQATAVEQARAVAEVQAAIVVAQQCPRSVNAAVAAMRQSCAQKGLADRAFFRFNRGGSAVTGATIQLARELARCWGNMQYGIAELRRDDAKGESEMIAFAWDVQTNTRATTTFVVKHLRSTRAGNQQLTDQRDIYENNANNGARRLREQIFAILPRWFTEEAQDLCHQTIERGDGEKPLASRVADAIKLFGAKGVSVNQLETKLARKSDDWTAHDVSQLGIVFKSINNGEVTIEDEFPAERVTAAEITKQATKTASTKASAQPPVDDNEPSQAELDAMMAEQS